MAKITGKTTATTNLTIDPIATAAGTTYYKEALDPKTGALDEPVAAQRVGTHVDDTALTVGGQTGTVVAVAGLADETSTDAVDEGDIGALRMTLNRRLVTAGQYADDTAFTAADYVTPIAAVADDASPDSVNEGDYGAVRMSLARALHVVNVADSSAVTTVNSSASSTTLLAANANRIGATIYNTDANDLYVKFGATASTSSFTTVIPSGAYFEFPQPVYRGVVDGIWAADGSGLAAMTELS